MENEEQRTIFCGNLSTRVTEELLYELFLQAAPLEKVKIPSDRGRQANYGFVTCRHVESVSYAINLLNGIALFERRIVLKPRTTAHNQQNHAKQSPPPWRSLPETVLAGEQSKRNHYDRSPAARKPYDRRPDYGRGYRQEHYERNHFDSGYGNRRRLRLGN